MYEQSVTLFYVSAAKDMLDCVHLSEDVVDLWDCSFLVNLPSLSVAPDSRQISMTQLVPTFDQRILLLTYKDLSQELVIMLGCLNVTTKTWFWRNETDKFNSLLPKYYSDLPEVHVTAACSSYSEMSSSSDRMDSFSDWMVLYCFKKDNYNSTSHQTNGIVQFNIKFSDNSNFMESVTVQSTGLYALLHSGQD